MAFPHSLPFQAFFIGCLPHWLLWQIAEPLDFPASRRPLLQGELVGNHGDELAIVLVGFASKRLASQTFEGMPKGKNGHFIAIPDRH